MNWCKCALENIGEWKQESIVTLENGISECSINSPTILDENVDKLFQESGVILRFSEECGVEGKTLMDPNCEEGPKWSSAYNCFSSI